MRSLLKVMKPRELLDSEDVVNIPDVPPQTGIDFSMVSAESEKLKYYYDQMIQQAEARSQQMIQGTMEKANQTKVEILAIAREEALLICEKARQEGLIAGARERIDEIDNCLAEVDEVLEQMANEQAQFMQNCARELQLLAVEIAGKLIHTKLEQDDLVLAGLVRKSMATIKGVDWISIELSDQLPKLVEYLSQDLHRKEQELGIKRIELSPGDRPLDSCILQTAEGTLDASISAQLANIIECFKRLQ